MRDPLLVLSWRAPADPGGALRRRVYAVARGELAERFRRAAPPEEGRAFLASLDALPPAARARLLGAPELLGRLAEDLDSDLEFPLDALRAERVRLGLEPPPDRPLWTALGDAVLGPVAPLRPRRLPQGALLDAVSPWAAARVPTIVERFEPYAPEPLRALCDRLEAAGGLLHRLCPEASALVAGFTRTVILRRDPEHPARWLSESTEGTLGRTLLVNPHLPEVGPLDLVEALVHEAVHAWLGALERAAPEVGGPFVPDRAAAEALAPASAWTGNTLDAERWAHAAFVWFAVLHLWRRAAAAGEPEAEVRYVKVKAGFGGLHDTLAWVAPALSPWARRALAALPGGTDEAP